ncbi:MAG: hypothetical protein HQP61_06935 [Peptococcaceae bacterium]|nr:hypothetical protein [Candidatus Syntrophopropionicum ammoniitolerans]
MGRRRGHCPGREGGMLAWDPGVYNRPDNNKGRTVRRCRPAIEYYCTLQGKKR